MLILQRRWDWAVVVMRGRVIQLQKCFLDAAVVVLGEIIYI